MRTSGLAPQLIDKTILSLRTRGVNGDVQNTGNLLRAERVRSAIPGEYLRKPLAVFLESQKADTVPAEIHFDANRTARVFVRRHGAQARVFVVARRGGIEK